MRRNWSHGSYCHGVVQRLASLVMQCYAPLLVTAIACRVGRALCAPSELPRHHRGDLLPKQMRPILYCCKTRALVAESVYYP